MRPDLHRLVLHTIREHALVGPTDRLAVALSGGPDSVALVWIVKELRDAGALPGRLAGVIHVNHGLRGAEADRDEQFCRGLAERLGLPIEATRLDVASAVRAARRSVETIARELRYRFFAEAAGRLGATAVATGHTIDDQAETVILRLLRGTSQRGLGAIRIQRSLPAGVPDTEAGRIIRPLLDCRRRDLRAYLASRGEPFCEDTTNQDVSVARNRVRQKLLPVIEELAPGGIEALARFASLAAADEAYLEQEAIKASESVVLSIKYGVQLSVGPLAALPAALGRRVVRRALETAAPGRAFSSQHLLAVMAMLESGGPGGHLDLPGVAAERCGDVLVLGRAAAGAVAAPEEDVIGRSDFDVALPVPGRAFVPTAEVWVTADRQDEAAADELVAGGSVAVVQEASVVAPLRVRNRRPGDRLRPFGAPGRRKLQDLFVDRKIPRAERDRVPIVVDATGRIVWVAGVAVADECRVTSPAAGVVVLKLGRE